jgi:hypothetical protein
MAKARLPIPYFAGEVPKGLLRTDEPGEVSLKF